MRLSALQKSGGTDLAVLQIPSLILDVGEGNLQSMSTALIFLPDFAEGVVNIDNLIKSFFPDIKSKYRKKLWLSQRAILPTINIQLGIMNESLRVLMPGKSRPYLNDDTIHNPEKFELRNAVEMLNSTPGTADVPFNKLSLKRSQMVELQRKLQQNKALVDGERYVGEYMTDIVLFLLIATGNHKR